MSKSQNQIDLNPGFGRSARTPPKSPSLSQWWQPFCSLWRAAEPPAQGHSCWTHQEVCGLHQPFSSLFWPFLLLRQVLGIYEHPINAPSSLICCWPRLSLAQTIAPHPEDFCSYLTFYYIFSLTPSQSLTDRIKKKWRQIGSHQFSPINSREWKQQTLLLWCVNSL